MILVRNTQICVVCVRILQSVDSNETNLTFGYCLPTSLLITYAKTILNHSSGEVGRSGLQLHHILTCISRVINV